MEKSRGITAGLSPLAQARLRTGLSLTGAAEHLAIARETLCRIERGAQPASESLIRDLAELYGRSWEWVARIHKQLWVNRTTWKVEQETRDADKQLSKKAWRLQHRREQHDASLERIKRLRESRPKPKK